MAEQPAGIPLSACNPSTEALSGLEEGPLFSQMQQSFQSAGGEVDNGTNVSASSSTPELSSQ
jgi:hypothetical protein